MHVFWPYPDEYLYSPEEVKRGEKLVYNDIFLYTELFPYACVANNFIE
jgi:hypothetical protein